MRSVMCWKLMRILEDLYSPNIQAWLNLYMQIMINPICNIKKIGASESKKLSNKFLLDVEILVLGKKYLYSVFNKRTKLAITEKANKL